MEDTASPRRTVRWWLLGHLMLLPLLTLAYPLGMGPAARWHENTTSPTVERTIEKIYAPLIWAWENVPAARRPIEWYMELWCD